MAWDWPTGGVVAARLAGGVRAGPPAFRRSGVEGARDERRGERGEKAGGKESPEGSRVVRVAPPGSWAGGWPGRGAPAPGG
jgi:hypothetical protein